MYDFQDNISNTSKQILLGFCNGLNMYLMTLWVLIELLYKQYWRIYWLHYISWSCNYYHTCRRGDWESCMCTKNAKQSKNIQNVDFYKYSIICIAIIWRLQRWACMWLKLKFLLSRNLEIILEILKEKAILVFVLAKQCIYPAPFPINNLLSYQSLWLRNC